jgi:hypothetical protein
VTTRKPKFTFPWKTDENQYQVLLPGKAGDIILHRSGTLYEAAAWLWLHVRRCYLPAIKSSDIDHCVLDTETSERWSFSELLAGHFMDDVLPLEALSNRSDARIQSHSASAAIDAWMSSSLVKRRYRKSQVRR